MSPIVWTKAPNQLREEGLIATLREISQGQEVIVPGWRATDVRCHIRSARRGTDKDFAARTLRVGAVIRRLA